MNAKPRKLSAYLAGVESLVNTSMYVVVVVSRAFQIKYWQYVIVSVSN